MADTLQGEQASPISPTFRFATPGDIALINYLDSFSSSPTRDIHREMEKYFGSVDPSTHECTLIFLADLDQQTVAKAELMLPPQQAVSGSVGYIKRVIVHPAHRQAGLARQLLQYVITYATQELHLASLDLHVWEENTAAIKLYTSLGFNVQHRELYFRRTL
jgi:ribosomal protein S18 acetylase RimI-like enzyme